jgi:hypothetical protein
MAFDHVVILADALAEKADVGEPVDHSS